MTKTLITLTRPLSFSTCGLQSMQAVYEQTKTKEKAKSVGSGATPTHNQHRSTPAKKSARCSHPSRPGSALADRHPITRLKADRRF